MSFNGKLDIGLDFNYVPSRLDAVRYDSSFCCVPVVRSEFEKRVVASGDNNYRIVPSDISLKGKDWNQLVYAKLPDDLHTSVKIRQLSRSLLSQEVDWSLYLKTRGIIVPLPRSEEDFATLSQLVNVKLRSKYKPHIIVKIPMGFSSETHTSGWRRWISLHGSCGRPENLSIALEMSEDLPSDEELSRWRAEPLKFIILKDSIFTTNPNGLPVLTNLHKQFVKSVFRRVALIVSGDSISKESFSHYSSYLNMIYTSHMKSVKDSASEEYENVLQYPLEPLRDNLESYTYALFEQDPVKYKKYQEAITKAIIDKLENSDNPVSNLVIMVVGAGRGPLVNCSLYAARRANVSIKVYAVEKNPFAVQTLLVHKKELWKNDDVEIVHSDMRYWNAPQKADIIVSELLGSFGDNELSPECLDGVQHNLKDDGISIPRSYSSYICPIQSAKLHRGAEKLQEKHCFERFFVVHQTVFYRIAPVQKVFTFVHPNKDIKIDNDRFCSLKFDVNIDCILHGFSGYFEAVLYDDITISIVPDEETDGMFSWFPVFIPISVPILLKSGDCIKFSIWRSGCAKAVWYEWCLNEPIPTFIHNLKGHSFSFDLNV